MEDDLGYDDVHQVHIERGKQGFGFNIKGTTATGGALQAVNGRLYPPLQYISHVDEGGCAWQAGLRCWDRILHVNGVDVKGASHNDVVQAIIKGGSVLDLVVMTVDDDEAARLQRAEDAVNRSAKKGKGKTQPISVVDYNNVPNPNGKGEFTVFNVFTHGEYRTSKRYSELSNFHKDLKNRFRWHTFPPFPPKKMNGLLSLSLNPAELEERRHGLEIYLQKLFGVDDIRDSDLMERFLRESSYVPPKVKRERENNRKREEARKAAQAKKTTPQQQSQEPSSSSTATVTPSAPEKPQAQSQSQTQAQAQAKDEKKQPQASKSPAVAAVDTAKANAPPKGSKKASAPPSTATSANLFDFDDDEALPVPSADKKVALDKNSDEQQEVVVADAVEALITYRVLLPTSRLVELELGSEITAGTLLEAVLDEVGVEGFARNIFTLFEATNSDAKKTSRPSDDFFARLVGANEKAAAVSGHLMLRRWLFTKEQEANAEDSSIAVELLCAQGVADIEHGRLFCGPKKKKKIEALKDQEGVEPSQLLSYMRKLHMYGGIKFPPCKNKDTEMDVVVTVAGDRIVIQNMDADGNPSTEEDGIVLIEVAGLKKVKRRDDLLALRAADSEGEVVTIRLVSKHAEFLEVCMKRALEEFTWTENADAKRSFFVN